MCNPTVLDRLNSLFEPNGNIVMNERGLLKDGSFRVVYPHKDFRVFMLYDPQFGEISRAMKNRGVQIHMPKDTSKHDTQIILLNNGLLLDDISRIDETELSGFPVHLPLRQEMVSDSASYAKSSSFPSSFLLLHCFDLGLNRMYSSLIRSGCLLYDYLQNSASHTELKYGLEYFLRAATPRDFSKRLALISKNKQLDQSPWIQAFIALFQHDEVVRAVEMTPHGGDVPLMLEGTSQHLDDLLLFIKSQWKQKKRLDSVGRQQNLKKRVLCVEEEHQWMSYDFTVYFSLLNNFLQSHRGTAHFGELLKLEKRLLKDLISSDSDRISRMFVLLWKIFEKRFMVVVGEDERMRLSVLSIQSLLEKIYPNYKLKSPLRGSIGRVYIFQNYDVLERILSLSSRSACLEKEFVQLLLQAVFSLYHLERKSVDEEEQESELKKLLTLVKRLARLKEQYEAKKGTVDAPDDTDELNNLFWNWGVVKQWHIHAQTDKILLSDSSEEYLDYLGNFSCFPERLLDVFPYHALKQSRNMEMTERTTKDLRFQASYRVFRELFGSVEEAEDGTERKFFFHDFRSHLFGFVMDFLRIDAKLSSRAQKGRICVSLVKFLRNEAKKRFEEMDVQFLKRVIRETFRDLGISNLDDVRSSDLLAPFLVYCKDLFGYVQASKDEIYAERARAVCWIEISALQLHMLRVFRPYDPLFAYEKKAEMLSKRIVNIERKMSEFEKIRVFLYGSSAYFEPLEKLALKKQELLVKLTSLRTKQERIQRRRGRNDENIALNHDTFVRLSKGMEDLLRLASVSKMQQLMNADNLSVFDTWNSNCDLLVKRLTASFLSKGLYQDILNPFLSSLSQLKYGVFLLESSLGHPEGDAEKERIMVELLGFSLYDSILDSASSAVMKRDPLLSACLLKRKMLMLKWDCEVDWNSMNLYSRWLFHILMEFQEKNQKRKAEEARMFKTKKETTVIKTDEEVLSEELNVFLPTYRSEYLECLPEEERKALEMEVKAEYFTTEENVRREQNELFELLFSFVDEKLRGSNKDAVLRRVGILSTQALNLLSQDTSHRFGSDFQNDLFLYQLDCVNYDISKVHGKKDLISNDIYQGENVFELSNCYDILLSLKSRIEQINTMNHPVLDSLDRLIEKISSLSVRSPLMKVLMGMEILWAKIMEWESLFGNQSVLGHSVYDRKQSGISPLSLKSHLLKISQFILRWRKIELSNWKTLFSKKRKEYEVKSTNQIFMDMLHLFLRTQDGAESSADFFRESIQVIDTYLLQSTLGNFSYRLKLLKVLQLMFLSKERQRRLTVIIQNIHAFYRQNFIVATEKKNKEAERILSRELAEFITLQKWENLTNVASIQTTLKRCRKKLSKILRRFEDEVLCVPFKPFFTSFCHQKELRSLKSRKLLFPKSFSSPLGRSVSLLGGRTSNILATYIISSSLVDFLRSQWRKDCLLSLERTKRCFEIVFPSAKMNRSMKKRSLMEMLLHFDHFVVLDSSVAQDEDGMSMQTILESDIGLLNAESPFFKIVFLYKKWKALQQFEDHLKSKYSNLYAKEILRLNKRFDQFFMLLRNILNVFSNVEEQIRANDEFVEFFQKITAAKRDGVQMTLSHIGALKDAAAKANVRIAAVNFKNDQKNVGAARAKNIAYYDTDWRSLTQLKLNEVLHRCQKEESAEENLSVPVMEQKLDFTVLIRNVKLLIQTLKEHMSKLPSEDEEEGKEQESCFAENVVDQITDFLEESWKEMKITLVLEEFAKLLKNDSSSASVSWLLKNTLSELESMEEFLGEYRKILLVYKRTIGFFYNTFEDYFEHLLIAVIRLFEMKFYEREDTMEEDGEMEEGEEQLENGGLGLDEGHGTVDMSDQIDNENQLMKDQKDNLMDMEEKEKEENDDAGVEPETDFAASQYDDDDAGEEDEEPQDDPEDEEMGEVDDRKIDKQLWNDEDDEMDDEDKEEKKGEELDKKVNQSESDELRAKEDSKEEEKEDKGEEKRQEQKPLEKIEYEERGEEEEEFGEQQEFVDKTYDKMDEEPPAEEEEEEFADDMEFGADDVEEEDVEDDEEKDVEMDTSKEAELEDEFPPNEEAEKDAGEKVDMDLDDEEDEDEKMDIDPELTDAHPMEENEQGKDERNQQVQFEKELEGTAYGAQMTGGESKRREEDDGEEEQERKEKEANREDAGESGKDVNKSEVGQSRDPSNDFDEMGETDENDAQQNLQLDINPLRKLGDALKEWQEKLDIVDDASKDTGEDDTSQQFEFQDVHDDDKDEYLQTIAPSDEKLNIFPVEEAEEEEEKDEEMLDKENPNRHDESMERSNMSRKPRKDFMEEKRDIATEVLMDIESDEDHIQEKVIEMDKNLENEVTVSLFPRQEHEGDVPEMAESGASWNRAREIDNLYPREKYEILTRRVDETSTELCEQLRLILTPTLLNRLKGDYKTGKRLNMKKIIPYIASDFKKDKIWLRREKPFGRDYNIVLCIDDSESMKSVGEYALESMLLLCKSLVQLEMGSLCVVKFGERTDILHSFSDAFSYEKTGRELCSQFSFSQRQSLFSDCLKSVYYLLEEKGKHQTYKKRLLDSNIVSNLTFIISDGILSHYKKCRHWIDKILYGRGTERNCIVFLLLDRNPDNPLMERQKVVFDKVEGVKSYPVLNDFPFPCYLIIRDLSQLPRSLSDTLRQFLQLNATD